MRISMGDKLLDGIEAIRARPESTRWAILVATTGVSAAILLVFWVSELSTNVQYVSDIGSSQNQELKSLLSPFDSVKETIQALEAGKDASEVVQNLEKAKTSKPAEVSKSQEPSWFRKSLSDARGILDFNLAMIATTFVDIGHSIKKSF